MRRLISAIGFLASTVAAATGASATTVEVVQPQVFVNRGDGYKPVTQTSGVAAGHIVMAAPNGSAKIVYDDGCVVEVKPGAVVPVYGQSPCPVYAGNSGSGRGWFTGSGRGYIIAGAVVAGVVGGAIAYAGGGGDDGNDAALKDDDDKGASP